MGDFLRVAGVDEIPVGTMKSFKVEHQRLAIARTADGFFAVADECSHDAAPISDGEIDDNEVVCERHGARFDLKTGSVTAPPAIVPIDTFPLKIDGNDILVKIED
jgi:3-phenylpropionate/trans-cinnamate dioxygenase ferredoxin subunit